MLFARKMSVFYIIIARKMFSRFFLGGGDPALPAPQSHTPMATIECRAFRVVRSVAADTKTSDCRHVVIFTCTSHQVNTDL